MSIDGIINEQYTNFTGKDGFFWWIGEVEDNKDPMNIGRVKCRVLNFYTKPSGGSADDLPTENLPWATVLQGTDQAGNDGQGQSSGQLQPGAIVMGFFLDGESAQMPVVMGVLRMDKGSKGAKTGSKKKFLFTAKEIPPGEGINASTAMPAGDPNSTEVGRDVQNTSVPLPGKDVAGEERPPSHTGPKSMGTEVPGSVTGNPQKPAQPEIDSPIPAASGTGGPIKSLEAGLKYLIQDLIDTAANLVKAEGGNYLNVVENKIVTAQELMAKIKNFLSAVFAQVVSALRLQIDELVQKIELASFITTFLGIPATTFALIQTAVSTLLSLICGLDSQLISLINAPIATLVGILNSFIDGAISQAEAAIAGVEAMIDQITCGVGNILEQALQVVQTVIQIVDGVGNAKEILETWKKGSQIFNGKFDFKKLSLDNIIQILTILMSLFSFGCNRESAGGQTDVGWFPFFGTTECTAAALAELPLGSNRKDCGGGGSGSFLDSFFDEASPYLTAAQTFINGAYTMQLGTPGREATITRTASGTTHCSVSANNEALAKHKATETVNAQTKGKDISQADKDKEIAKYVKEQSGGSGDKNGNLKADHISYGGNLTQSVPDDDCKTVGGDYCRTINGDYRLKITGDCHIEVGGGYFFNAQGAPKIADNNGKEKGNKKIQKHTMSFGSDLDLITNGANLKLQATQMSIGARELALTGSLYKNDCKIATYGCGEFIVNAGNAMTFNTTTMIQNVNFLPPKPGAGSYLVNVGGPVTFTQIPGGATKIPPFVVTTPGPFTVTCAAGGALFTVAAGAFTATVKAGAIAMTASAAVTITAGGAMNLTASAAMVLTASVIKLN